MCNGNRAEVVVGEYDFRFIPHAEDSFAAFNFIQREYISGWVKCNFDAFRKYKRSMLHKYTAGGAAVCRDEHTAASGECEFAFAINRCAVVSVGIYRIIIADKLYRAVFRQEYGCLMLHFPIRNLYAEVFQRQSSGTRVPFPAHIDIGTILSLVTKIQMPVIDNERFGRFCVHRRGTEQHSQCGKYGYHFFYILHASISFQIIRFFHHTTNHVSMQKEEGTPEGTKPVSSFSFHFYVAGAAEIVYNKVQTSRGGACPIERRTFMKYINELREGENVIEHYLCKTRQSMKSRNGKTYLSLKLQDKTGMVDAKVWDMTKDIQSFAEGDFIKIDAFVTTFNNDLQLNVKRVRRSHDGEYDPADFVPCTEKNIDEMYNTLMGYIKTISNQHIKKLLEEVFLRHPVISKEFKYHSAAKNMHHSFRGGLVEHTLSVTETCDFLAPRYKFVNRDILIACAMLHDVAKVMELSDFPQNDYTDEGQLLGHIFMGAELVRDTAAGIEGFPEQLKTLMMHCILAHHGELEFGSPKVPETIEAFLLHCADNLDAKTKTYEEMLAADTTQGSWAGYHRMLQRNIRRSDFE